MNSVLANMKTVIALNKFIL